MICPFRTGLSKPGNVVSSVLLKHIPPSVPAHPAPALPVVRYPSDSDRASRKCGLSLRVQSRHFEPPFWPITATGNAPVVINAEVKRVKVVIWAAISRHGQISVPGFIVGNRMLNTDPSWPSEEAQILPPWASTIDRQMDSPIPMPSDFEVKNDSKIRLSWFGSIPVPESSIDKSTPARS